MELDRSRGLKTRLPTRVNKKGVTKHVIQCATSLIQSGQTLRFWCQSCVRTPRYSQFLYQALPYNKPTHLRGISFRGVPLFWTGSPSMNLARGRAENEDSQSGLPGEATGRSATRRAAAASASALARSRRTASREGSPSARARWCGPRSGLVQVFGVFVPAQAPSPPRRAQGRGGVGCGGSHSRLRTWDALAAPSSAKPIESRAMAVRVQTSGLRHLGPRACPCRRERRAKHLYRKYRNTGACVVCHLRASMICARESIE